MTHKEFVARVKEARQGRVKVVSIYESIQEQVTCICLKCGNRTPWSAKAIKILEQTDCPHQNNHIKLTHEKYASIVHAKTGGRVVPVCTCDNPGVWDTLPQNFLYVDNYICPRGQFSRKKQKTLNKYVSKALSYGLKPLSAIKDVKNCGSVKHECLKCHECFDVLPRVLLYNKQPKCPKCEVRKVGFSQKAIYWLEAIASANGLKIKHATNGGEFRVPGTKLRVDGFCEKTNTIYEFYGDCWHGNLDVFSPGSKPNPFSDLTAKQLHKATLERENLLRDLGYKVISVWENDYA